MTAIGFTGTRRGMTDAQKWSFRSFISRGTSFHHGDCVGADDEAANIVREVVPSAKVTCHPPEDEAHRAFNPKYDYIRGPKTHFARNRDIVDETDELVATPMDTEHQPRGGTWYTVDYARKKGKPVTIIWPDGTIEGEK